MMDDDTGFNTTECIEAAANLEKAVEHVRRARATPYEWKWVILSLHGALQGFMVLALRGSAGLDVLSDRNLARWLDAHEKGTPYPPEFMADFPTLYERVKAAGRMEKFTFSRTWEPAEAHDEAVRRLNALRRQFTHYIPMALRVDVSSLPGVFGHCLDVIEFLGWQCGNVLWDDDQTRDRAGSALRDARDAIASFESEVAPA